PYGTAIVEGTNIGNLVQGYATFTLPTGVGGYGVFRQSVAGTPDQEAVVPFSSASVTTATLIFDETVSTTAFAIVNQSSAAASVRIMALGARGATIGQATLILPPLNH